MDKFYVIYCIIQLFGLGVAKLVIFADFYAMKIV